MVGLPLRTIKPKIFSKCFTKQDLPARSVQTSHNSGQQNISKQQILKFVHTNRSQENQFQQRSQGTMRELCRECCLSIK